MFKNGFFLISLLLLCACAAYLPPPKVTITTDEFSPNVELDGPMARDTVWSQGITYEWGLVTFINKKTHAVTHALYFTAEYDGQRDHFIDAYDDTATRLNVTVVGSDKGACFEGDCSIFEQAQASLNDSYLRERLKEGFRIKVITRGGTRTVLSVSPHLIQMQLDALEQYLHPAAKPAPQNLPSKPPK